MPISQPQNNIDLVLKPNIKVKDEKVPSEWDRKRGAIIPHVNTR